MSRQCSNDKVVRDWRKQRIEKGGGRQVWPHIYEDQAGESKKVGSLDVDALRSGSLETLIQFDSRTRRWYWLVLPGLSTAIMVISFLECPGRLKCLATGFSLLFLASPQCCCLRVLLVSPTYCWLHLLQVMTYMILVDSWVNGGWWSFPQ